METLSNLEAFVLSAETGSFSAAARRLGLSPAALSKSVARLESGLGVLLFQRSTHKLTLTEAGEHFLQEVSGSVASIRNAVSGLAGVHGQPAGVLKLSVPIGFGFETLLDLLPEFVRRYPAVTPDIRFENRQVDLIAEGFDAAVGGAIELTPGVVARELARIHVVALAAPDYLRGRAAPRSVAELAQMSGIVIRSTQSGRLRSWALRNAQGEEANVELKPSVIVNDPEAMCRCAALGLGVTLAPLTQAAAYLERGALVRLLPDWYGDAGPVSLYFSGQRLLPAKTRAFVDFMVGQSRERKLAQRLSAA